MTRPDLETIFETKMSHYLEWRDWSRDHFWDQNGLDSGHTLIMTIIITIVDNNNDDNDNYCHPPDAISASIKRSSKIESLPRSLPHWKETLKGSFREDIFWEDIKSVGEDIEHFSFFVCSVSRVVGGYKDGNFVCNTKGEELNFMLEIYKWKRLTENHKSKAIK